MKVGFKNFYNNIKLDFLATYYTFTNNNGLIFAIIISIFIYVLLSILYPLYSLIFIISILLAILVSFAFMYRDYYLSEYRKFSRASLFDVNLNKEIAIEYEVWKMLNSQNVTKKIIIDSYIPKINGETAQIDMIMISNYGIYVFECKSTSGFIHGDGNSSNITVQYNRNAIYDSYNPIMQNKYHIKHLNGLLNVDYSLYKSFIVYGNNCTLATISNLPDNTFVLNRKQLNFTLSTQFSSFKELLTDNQINEIYDKLKPYTCVRKKVKKKHIEDVKKYKKNK